MEEDIKYWGFIKEKQLICTGMNKKDFIRGP